MSDLKSLQEEFDKLIARKQVIKICGEVIDIPEGWAAEFAPTGIGFKVNMMRITIREITLAAEESASSTSSISTTPTANSSPNSTSTLVGKPPVRRSAPGATASSCPPTTK